MSFLKAEWRKLVLANYTIDQEVLEPFVPPKTELDLWKGKCYVSLVGFMFLNIQLLGVPVPFHKNFEEVNLRFYVRYKDVSGWKRGVVFIKEIVPKPALTFVANTIYKEHYQTLPMQHFWSSNEKIRTVAYSWKLHGQEHSIRVKAALAPEAIARDSEGEFITEHYWGYTKANDRNSFEYEVTHPRWEGYEVLDYDIKVDFSAVYGQAFEVLNQMNPVSVMLAEGSEITVENKRKI